MTQQTRSNFISTVASTLTDGGANTAAEVRTILGNDIDSCLVILTDTSDVITEGSTNLFLTSAERTKLSNTSGTNTGDQTSVSGNAGTVTVVDAASDSTTWVLLGTSQTGSLSPATDAGITYNASTNALTATSFVGALTGKASTATTLATSRTIGGVSFNGSANIVPQTIQTLDETADTTCFPMFVLSDGSQVGGQAPKTSPSLTYNSNTGGLAATSFTGSFFGNASTATALQTARNINGTSFNGTSDITVTAAAGTLTGTTLNATVVTSSLTAVGTITSGTWNGTTIAVARGGTGATTLTGILKGNGTSAFTAATAETDYVTPTGTGTLSSKRITPRVTTIASSATPTPDGNASDLFTVTALAAGAVFAAPTGTPVNGQALIIRIKDNGTARTLGWNAIYRAVGITLPTTTVLGKTLYLGMIYNSADAKWDVIGLSQEA